MRIIKFRAWHKKRLQMEHEIEIACYADHSFAVSSPNGGSTDDFELMQFTGLLDKNGKEIFEGDILRWQVKAKDDFSGEVRVIGDHLLEVKWGQVGWVLKSRLFQKHGSDECNEFNTGGYLGKSEVVGNIYENPELLANHREGEKA